MWYAVDNKDSQLGTILDTGVKNAYLCSNAEKRGTTSPVKASALRADYLWIKSIQKGAYLWQLNRWELCVLRVK